MGREGSSRSRRSLRSSREVDALCERVKPDALRWSSMGRGLVSFRVVFRFEAYQTASGFSARRLRPFFWASILLRKTASERVGEVPAVLGHVASTVVIYLLLGTSPLYPALPANRRGHHVPL